VTAGGIGSRRGPVGLVLPLAVVGCWQLLSPSGALDLQFLPAPEQIGRSLLVEAASGELAADLGHTLAVAVAATAIAALVGGALGIVLGLAPALRTYLAASVDFLRTVPAIALMPVALLALGPRGITELVLATYAAIWPVVLNTAAGVAAVPARLRDVARVLHLSPAGALRTIIIPAAVPSWLAGARTSAIIALHVTLIAEMVIAPNGLGGGLIESLNALDPSRAWAYALTCGFVGYLLHGVLRRVVRTGLPGSTAAGTREPT
jgi:NitT/TauT family transport system permease protein